MRSKRPLPVRSQPTLRSFVLGPLTLLLAACGVSASSPDPATYVDYVKQLAQLGCESRLRCCGTLCSDAASPTSLLATQRVGRYIEAGLLRYDRQAAIDCLRDRSLRYADCGAPIPNTTTASPCDRVLVPLGGEGTPCESKITSCVSGSLCQNGYCVAQLKLGQTCVPGSTPCTPDGYCVRNTATGIYTCTQYAQSGQPCTQKLCDPLQGLICSQTTLLCTPLLAEGSPCVGNSTCASGYCDAKTGVCASASMPLTVIDQLCAAP